MAKEVRVEDLAKLSNEQLQNITQQFTGEVKFFNQSLTELKIALASFANSRTAVKKMSEEATEGKESLVPLSDTIFVKAKPTQTDKYIIEIGTGYYAEMSAAAAERLFDRKHAYIQTQMQTIVDIISSKTSVLKIIEEICKKRGLQIVQQ